MQQDVTIWEIDFRLRREQVDVAFELPVEFFTVFCLRTQFINRNWFVNAQT